MTEEMIKTNIEVDQNGCWLWLGAIKNTGYARFGQHYVHRESYQIFNGPIEPGLVIDHKCEVKHCVNPEHLRVVTQQFNILRGTANSAKNARKIRCKRGHLLTGSNLLKSKARRCKICMRWRQAGDPRYIITKEATC